SAQPAVVAGTSYVSSREPAGRERGGLTACCVLVRVLSLALGLGVLLGDVLLKRFHLVGDEQKSVVQRQEFGRRLVVLLIILAQLVELRQNLFRGQHQAPPRYCRLRLCSRNPYHHRTASARRRD